MLRPHKRSVGVVIDLNTLGSPNQIHCELRRIISSTVPLRLWDQLEIGPSGDLSQSNARIRAPISPHSRAKLKVRNERPWPLSLSRAPETAAKGAEGREISPSSLLSRSGSCDTSAV
jgi:hypothetical protein